MFKIFKKYAVLDVVETDHYEAYCMYEQVAGGYAGSLYDAERDLLTTYYKSKTTKSSMKEIKLSQRHCRLGVRQGFLFSVFEIKGSMVLSIGVSFVILRLCWIHTAQFQAICIKVCRAFLRRSGLSGKKFLTAQVL